MKSNLSAFLDDELDGSQQATVLSAICRDEGLRRAWDSYHLIGDALRHAPALDRRLASRVMQSLDHEPALAAPRTRRGEHRLRAAMALAATAAGVAVVAWIALGMQTSMQSRQVVAQAQSKPAPVVPAAANNRLQEYMVAHQTYSPANRILGGTAYVRTVSAPAAEGQAR